MPNTLLHVTISFFKDISSKFKFTCKSSQRCLVCNCGCLRRVCPAMIYRHWGNHNCWIYTIYPNLYINPWNENNNENDCMSEPSVQMLPKWGRIDVDATSSCRIDVNTTSFYATCPLGRASNHRCRERDGLPDVSAAEMVEAVAGPECRLSLVR